MVFCTNCGADMEEHTKFCPECGSKVELNEHPTAGTKHIKKDDTDNVPNDSTTPTLIATKKGVLDRLDIEKNDIDQVTEKAKKGLGRLGRFARKGLERGAELASQGIDAAKETLDERRETSDNQDIITGQEGEIKFCPHCGKAIEDPGKFCNHCGEKLE
jgi:RNA polymerase subunit RPABC4/transcription elongation factor Spt4